VKPTTLDVAPGITRRTVVSLTFFMVLAVFLPAVSFAAERQNVTLTTSGGTRLTLSVVTSTLYRPGSKLPVILALPPGAGDLAMVNAFLANYWLEEADRRGYIIVSPTVMGRSLETAAQDVLDTVFGWMNENMTYDEERIVIAGQSNGGLGAFHAARVEPDRFTGMIVMPGGFGGQGSLDMLSGMPILMAVGERDTGWVELTRNTRDLLVLAGAEPVVDVVPGAGHVFPYDPEDLFDWIEATFPD